MKLGIMKFRGEKRFYWQCGIFEALDRFEWEQFRLRCLFLIKRPPAGELMRFGRNYIGINYASKGWHAPYPRIKS